MSRLTNAIEHRRANKHQRGSKRDLYKSYLQNMMLEQEIVKTEWEIKRSMPNGLSSSIKRSIQKAFR